MHKEFLKSDHVDGEQLIKLAYIEWNYEGGHLGNEILQMEGRMDPRTHALIFRQVFLEVGSLHPWICPRSSCKKREALQKIYRGQQRGDKAEPPLVAKTEVSQVRGDSMLPLKDELLRYC